MDATRYNELTQTRYGGFFYAHKKMTEQQSIAELETLVTATSAKQIGGRHYNIKRFTISQIPSVRNIALSLFNSGSISFNNDMFDVDIEGEHVALMKSLITLATGLTAEELELDHVEFFTLFAEVLEKNSDFFLKILKKMTSQAVGLTSLSLSDATE